MSAVARSSQAGPINAKRAAIFPWGLCLSYLKLRAVDEDCVLIFISHGPHSTQPSTQPRTHALGALKLARHPRRCIACHVCILTLAMTHGSRRRRAMLITPSSVIHPPDPPLTMNCPPSTLQSGASSPQPSPPPPNPPRAAGSPTSPPTHASSNQSVVLTKGGC